MIRTSFQSIENPSGWAIHALNPLDTYVSGRVAILGDAVTKKIIIERICLH